MRHVGVAIVIIVAIGWWAPCRERAEPLRVATFNIENFPKHPAQVAGAFDEIEKLDASVVGLQEITDPLLFDREARRRLGAHWRSVFPAMTAHAPTHYTGVLFDGRRWVLEGTTLHDDTRLDGGHKPTLEVVLRDREDARLHVLVVHLKAGADGRAIRARQYEALARILARERGRTIVLGDFNATDDRADRADLVKLARTTRLRWATEHLACSAFWDRDDGCFRSRLDHVLAWRAPSAIELGGACATHGCDREDVCPLYVARVSDHCPVVVELAPE